MPIRGNIWADGAGRPAAPALGVGLTSVVATPPLVLTLAGTVLTGAINTGALPPRIRVKKNGVLVGTRGSLNLLEGADTVITAVEDAPNDEIEVTIATTGGGGGGALAGLTAGRYPVANSDTSVIDGKIFSTAPGSPLYILGREDAVDDYAGVRLSSSGNNTVLEPVAAEPMIPDTNPGLIMQALGASSVTALSLQPSDAMLSCNDGLSDTSLNMFGGGLALTAMADLAVAQSAGAGDSTHTVEAASSGNATVQAHALGVGSAGLQAAGDDAAVGLHSTVAAAVSARWELRKSSASGESGSDVGSDLALRRYDDSGALIDSVMDIVRSTGKLTHNGDVDVAVGKVLRGTLLDRGGMAYNAKAYGVVADPDTTDDTAAIQALFDGLVSGDAVHFPPGRYKLSATIQIGDGSTAGASSVSYLTIKGSGQGVDVGNLNPGYGGATVFEWDGPAGDPVFQINGPITVNMSDFDILGTVDGNTCGDGILAVYAMMSTFERISVRRHGGWALNMTCYATRPTGASNNPANNMVSQYYGYYGAGTRYGGLSLDSPDTGGGVGCDVVQATIIGCKWTGSANEPAVLLGFVDNCAFFESIINNQAGGSGLKIYPSAAWPLFPLSISFYNCHIGGTTPIEIDESRATWTAATVGVRFYPWVTSDSGAFPLPNDTRFGGFGDDGMHFGRDVRLSGSHLTTTGTAPTVALGASAGVGATSSLLNSTDTGGLVKITTGLTPSAPDVVLTLTFARPFATRAHVVLIPHNAAAAALSGATQVFAQGGTTAFIIYSGTAALTASTDYYWTYHVIGV